MKNISLQYCGKRLKARNAFMSVLLIAVLIFCLAGCNSSSGTGEEKKETETGASDLREDQVSFNDIIISLDDDAEPVIESLGKPDSYEEYPSCLFEGSDKLWDYGSLRIQGYPDGDKDYVLALEIMDDKPEISSGIKVGNSMEDAEKAYGDKLVKESSGIYRVDGGDYGIDFYIGEGDRIDGITIYLPTDAS